ncbi:methyltransferase domain-containing protein [[Haemophilus] felis]|uniref:Methyltransferase n=1 Tax=[Haemophilus] felis TaxID=123822 RepID=A0A1T0AXY2_9PAST|nr:methyltransferase domain-containing protein [[Haemophilus] felis]NBI40516.1 methyltransferase domain-containing protein [[Haemophilus] felis]OOS02529.1 hypothetical protein B0188_08385 [[Haemophilus] felis]
METLNQPLKDSYNEFPYKSQGFAHTQPGRLQALARMKGLTPPALENARVLEIGCSYGGNIIPFALRYPNAKVVGVDLSEHQIDVGKQILKELEIDNIELIQGDICQVSFDTEFDYIICHGVFSWVPENVQEGILQAVSKYLSPNGVAFISYNTYPGWKIKEIAKDLMIFGSKASAAPAERVSQSFNMLKFVNNYLNGRHHQLAKPLSHLFNHIMEQAPYYITHEYFETYNKPMYFLDFVEKVEEFGLSYLTDSRSPIVPHYLYFKNDEWEQLCQGCEGKVEFVEQFVDFLLNKEFRNSVITRRENLVANNVSNHIEVYNKCFNFEEIHFMVYPIEYVEATDDEMAHWAVESDKIQISANKHSNLLFNYLKEREYQTVNVGDVLRDLKNHPDFDEGDATNLLFMLIHNASTYIGLHPISRSQSVTDKPFMLTKIRKLIEIIQQNPNLLSLSDIYTRIIEFDYFAYYLSQHLDGTNNLQDLMAIINKAVEDKKIQFYEDGQPIGRDVIDDKRVEEYINNCLKNFHYLGFLCEKNTADLTASVEVKEGERSDAVTENTAKATASQQSKAKKAKAKKAKGK